MKEGWVYMSLGEICDFISGFTPKKEELNSERGIPYFKVSDMNRLSNSLYLTETELFVKKAKKIIPANSIVFPKNGGAIFTGKKRILACDSIVDLNTEAIKINNNNVLLTYLFQYLLFVDFGQFDNGGGLPSINIKKMKEHIIPVPSLSDQQRIVTYLDAEFAKIEALKANAEKQLQAAKDLFQAALKELLTPKEGWVEKIIKDVGEVIGGSTPNTNVPEFWNGNNCWISPAELKGSHYLYDSVKKITDLAIKKKNLKLLPVGTVILSSRAPIGKVVINKVPTYCNQGFKCVVCKNDLYNEFLYWFFYGNTDYLNSLGTGATFPEISKGTVENIPINYPPISEQQRIADRLDALSANVKALQTNYTETITLCNDLKQALLKKVFG